MCKVTGHSLLVDMSDDGPIPDGVYCFGTSEEALVFAVKKLREWDNHRAPDDGEDMEDYLDAFQDGLDGHDYYHIRQIRQAT